MKTIGFISFYEKKKPVIDQGDVSVGKVLRTYIKPDSQCPTAIWEAETVESLKGEGHLVDTVAKQETLSQTK